MEQIGDRIREIRKINQMTQKKFGETLGISYGHISNIEKNKDVPSETIIKLICYEYHVSENWLKNGQGEMIDNGNNLSNTNQLLIMLDDILASSTETNRKTIADILINLELILINSNQLSAKTQNNNLEILNNIMDKIYSVTNLFITSNSNSSKILDEMKLDNYLDDIFGDFSNLIELYSKSLHVQGVLDSNE